MLKLLNPIARDENVHLASTQQMLKSHQDDKDYEKIAKELKEECNPNVPRCS